MTDRDSLALTLYGEARGESTAGRLAVACVIQNRLRDGRWGASFEAVCFARKQFSCWNATDPNSAMLHEMAAAVLAGRPSNRILRECYWIADGVLTKSLGPQVGKSTHYYATSMTTPPRWAKGVTPYAVIGHHRFFEGIA
jgi:spore germination cell wall hydrolase CwlJ-like protein